MSFPVVQDLTVTTSAIVTSFNISMPATVSAGELLLVFVVNTFDLAGGSTAPTGFTEIGTGNDGDNCRVYVYAKKATGSEGGTTVTFTPGDNAAHTAHVYRISGWKDSGVLTDDIKANFSIGTGGITDPNPPNSAPGWGAEDTLWFAGCCEDITAYASTDVPANYGNGTKTQNTNGARASVLTCYRFLNASSEDPGPFPTIAAGRIGAFTIAVRAGTGATNRKGQASFIEFEVPINPAAVFPKVEDITETRDTVSSNTFIINYPATVNVGDAFVLFMALGNPGSPDGYVLPSGWTPICDSGEGGNTWFFCLARAAVGNEDGTTLTITLNAIAFGKVAQMYRISNWFNGGAITSDIQGNAQFQATTTPNPQSLTPTWGLNNTLWIEAVAGDVSAYSVTDVSANYGNGSKTVGAGRSHTLTGRRQNAVATEDPGQFTTLAVSGRVHVMTIAVRPAITGDRRGRVSHAEMETQAGPTRRARMYHAEVQVPDVGKKGQVGQAELQVPDQPTNRKGRIPHAEFEIPIIGRMGVIAHGQLEVPNPLITPPPIIPFILLVDQDVAMEISLVNDSTTTWSQSGNTYTYALGTRNIIGTNRKEIVSVSVNGKDYSQANSLTDVNSTGETFVYLAGTNEISINPTSAVAGGGTTAPNTAIILARFQMRWSNYAVDFEGYAYENRLMLRPDDASIRLSIEDELMTQGSIVGGSYRIANGMIAGESYNVDQLLRDYIFLGQKTQKRVYDISTGEVTDCICGNGYVAEIRRRDIGTTFTLWI